MATVRIAASFVADVEAQVEWIAEHFPASHVDALQQAVHEAVALLSRFPAAGSILDESRSPTLRRLVLRRLPFVVLYTLDSREREPWLLRLFHARQHRPHPPRGRRREKR